ncbi:MAG: PASTA domain-containing protein [Collinsella sp.]
MSTGPDTIDVPNLTGKTKEQAIEALGDKLSYTFSSDYSATVPAGSVISYEPWRQRQARHHHQDRAVPGSRAGRQGQRT